MAKKKGKKNKVETLNQMLADHFKLAEETVSRALNGHTSGPDATRIRWGYERIREFINTL